jgi:hypothetical protein
LREKLKEDDVSKGKLLIGGAVVFSLAVLIYAASYSSGEEEEAAPVATRAERKFDQMNTAADSGALPVRVGRSGADDVVDYMGRSADQMERSPSGYREFHYDMGDGSSLVFVFEAADSGGLVLHHYKAE